MDKAQIIALLFGSAAIAALISAGMTAWTTHLERKSRRAETLLKAAMDLADWRLNLAVKNAENLKTSNTRMLDKVVYTEQYYRLLDHLMKHGKLPDQPHIERE